MIRMLEQEDLETQELNNQKESFQHSLMQMIFGQKINFPLFLAPTAMHRLYHHEGEKASAKATEMETGQKFG